MKYYAIGVMAVLIVFMGSVFYKQQQNTKGCCYFPIPESLRKNSNDVPFYLFLFFSKHDCPPCITEIVEVLETLPPQFCIAGISSDAKHLNGTFPLYNSQDDQFHLPWHTPTIIGVSPSGKSIFVLPVIREQLGYLRNTIVSIYGKVYPSFEKEYSLKKGESK